MNTYKLITNQLGEEYIEMQTPEGIISFVPINPANSDYQEYLKSLDEASTL